MPADLTREQLDRYRHPGLHFLDKGGLDVTVARGMFEHLLEIAEAHLSEPTSITALEAENARLREGLDFYAWVDHYNSEEYRQSVVAEDRGRRARALLQGGPDAG